MENGEVGRRMNYLIRAGVARRASNRIKCEIALAKFLRMHSLFAYLLRLLPIRSQAKCRLIASVRRTEPFCVFFFLFFTSVRF